MHKFLAWPLTIASITALLAAGTPRARAESGAENAGDAALARTVAFDATVFGYPLDGMYRRLTREALDPATRVAGFNAFYHYRRLATPTVSPFPAPNNDTLYSTAWIDLRREPAILSMPDTKGRYYTAHVLDLTTETIANIGQRLDGTKAGLFALVGSARSAATAPTATFSMRSAKPATGVGGTASFSQ